jgi:DNA polymerase-3 subunit epsilon
VSSSDSSPARIPPEAIFTAFDVETTGLIPGVDRIVEIGAVRFRADGILDTFETLVDPGISMPEEAGVVNGITDEMLKGKPHISDELPRFLAYLGGSYPVAHNAAFDVGFVSAEAVRLGLSAPDVPVLDTRTLAIAAFPGRASYGLDVLARAYGLSAESAHRALSDARTCRELFLVCVEKLTDRGITDIDALLKLSGGPLSLVSNRPPEVERIVALSAALAKGTQVEIVYASSRGERTVRKITPLAFRIVGGSPAVEAHCHLREEKRTFLIASIESINELP